MVLAYFNFMNAFMNNKADFKIIKMKTHEIIWKCIFCFGWHMFSFFDIFFSVYENENKMFTIEFEFYSEREYDYAT